MQCLLFSRQNAQTKKPKPNQVAMMDRKTKNSRASAKFQSTKRVNLKKRHAGLRVAAKNYNTGDIVHRKIIRRSKQFCYETSDKRNCKV